MMMFFMHMAVVTAKLVCHQNSPLNCQILSFKIVSVLAIRVIYVNDNLDYYKPVNEFDKRSYI